mgnify:CR=1 FL=1
MSKPFYITTTTPYVNSDPHLGFALEIVEADILVRFHKVLGDEIFFNTGTDEHGVKIYRKAEEVGKSAQEYVDSYAARFKELLPVLNISSDINFIRTTDAHHKSAAQEFWKRCLAGGDIYKKEYEVKYCVGCELEKTDSELVDGKCPIHPNLEVEIIKEENYFFRFSKYQQPLLDYYKQNKEFVIPDFRFNEIRKFVEGGLQDFSVSRLKAKMPWGVAVPDDETQVMYVWFDALVNYISALGWPEEESDNFKKFWGSLESPNGVQIAGKDNLRQQSAMWQAMLMSAGLPNSKQIIIHGFINSDGQKMSKSLGNVIDPFEVVEKYGADALRYWISREMSTFEDGDFTWDKFKESYNANLANGLGNLTSRILKMAVNAELATYNLQPTTFDAEFSNYLEKREIQKAADWIWVKIKAADEFIAKEEPFKKVKVDVDAGKKDIGYLLGELSLIAYHAQPFLPDASQKILMALQNITLETIPRLFPRIE